MQGRSLVRGGAGTSRSRHRPDCAARRRRRISAQGRAAGPPRCSSCPPPSLSPGPCNAGPPPTPASSHKRSARGGPMVRAESATQSRAAAADADAARQGAAAGAHGLRGIVRLRPLGFFRHADSAEGGATAFRLGLPAAWFTCGLVHGLPAAWFTCGLRPGSRGSPLARRRRYAGTDPP